MIVVHDIFVCKPGNASKLAKLFKETMTAFKEMKMIMTDYTGQYHRVIMVTEFESLSAFEKNMENFKNPTDEMKQAMEKMKDMNDMYVSGSREIFKAW
jgi:heme-degrading monooxygenase HmoA